MRAIVEEMHEKRKGKLISFSRNDDKVSKRNGTPHMSDTERTTVPQ